MKLVLLLCVVGYALSSSLTPEWRGVYWKSDTEYVFEYTGRMLTGVPELASQYTGVSIKCKVHINVKREGNDYKFGIHLTDSKYVRVNDVLHTDDSHQTSQNNWRYVNLPPYSDLPSEQSQYLANQVVLKLRESGEFKVMEVRQDEPEWSVNFKKALVSLLQTKFNGSQEQINQELIQNNELKSKAVEGEVITWKTREESLDGTCDVIYQLNELPEYVIMDVPKSISYPEECKSVSEGGKYFELIKTRDISSCSKFNSFQYYKPGFFQCHSGNCEGMWTRNSVTRYTACGTVDKMQIQTITNEGELQQNLFGIKTEKFMTGTRQILKLVQTRQSSSSIHDIPSSRMVDNLYYEYTKGISQILSSQTPEEIEQIQREQSSSEFKSIPRGLMIGGLNKQGGNPEPEKLIPEIKRLFKQLINEDFTDVINVPKKQITMKALNVARSMSLLRKEYITRIYQDLKSEFSSEEKTTMFKNIFYDTLVLGGSNENIMFIKEQIQSGELSTMQTISIFAFLPQYVIAPRELLLKNLYELITSDSIKEQRPLVFNHAVLSFSILLQKACLAENRFSSYPTYLYGEFCQPDSSIVTQKWLPFLRRELEQTQSWDKKNLIITALGFIEHKEVISILMPYVEQMVESSRGDNVQTTRLARFLSVYSLVNAGRRHPDLVMPVMVSIFTNNAENTEIRIAAFNVIMKLNPSSSVLQTIASSTWYEKNREILNVVNSAFYTLSNEQGLSYLNKESESLKQKVWLVYPLIKKVGGRFPSSGSIFNSEYMRQLGVGYEYFNSWTSSKDSLFPSDIYSKMIYVLERYEFSPFEFGLHLKGGESIVQQLVNILLPENDEFLNMNKEEIAEQVKKQIHGEWREIIEQLGIKSRDSESSENALYINFFENFPVFRTFQSTSSQMLKEKLSQVLRKDVICGKYPVNFQRVHNLAPAEFTVPSEMGLPIVIEVHMPVAVSFRGHMNVDCSTSLPSVQMDVRTLFASQMVGWVGTICPFTKEYVVSGLDEHAVLNLPVEFKVDFNPHEKKLNVKINPVSLNNKNTEVDLFHYHVRPFGIAQDYYNLTPMTISDKVKFIESPTQIRQLTYPFGEQFGTSLKFVVNSESRFVDLRSLFERFQMFNWNFLNIARFGWASTALSETGKPSLRRHEYQIKYDPSSSSTKEIEFQLQLETVTKQRGQEAKTHKIVVDQRRVVPYKLEKVSASAVGSESVQKAKQILEKSNIQEGTGIFVRMSTVLKGSRTRSWNYNFKLAAGQESYYKSKWDLHLENESDNTKICLNGEFNLPNLPVWKIQELRDSHIQVHFRNDLGFGQDCSQHKIKVTGESQVSRKQKEFSKNSGDAQLLKKMLEKNVPLAQVSEVADRVRKQATTLDEVDFKVEYENVPEEVMRKSRFLISALKAVWWPYVEKDQQKQQQQGSFTDRSMTSQWKFVFDASTKTFDLTIDRPSEEHVTFRHIRIPYYLRFFFPMNTLRGPLSQGFKGITGVDLTPVCSVEKQYVKNFANHTSGKLPFDYCFRLLSAECKQPPRYTVLIRAMEQEQEARELKVFIGQTVLFLSPSFSGSNSVSDLYVKINGTRRDISRGQHIEVRDDQNEVVATIKKTQDNVLDVQFNLMRVVFDGYKAQLFASPLLKNKLCGLCGDINHQMNNRLVGPKMCTYSDPEVLSAAYRVNTRSLRCDVPLDRKVEQKLRQEQERCAKYQELPTKVNGALAQTKTSPEHCTRHQHQMVQRQSSVCFSRKPLPQCDVRCKTPEGQKVEKEVSFTCIRKGRTADLYEQKVLTGKVVPELEQLPETFTVKTWLPRECVPISQQSRN